MIVGSLEPCAVREMLAALRAMSLERSAAGLVRAT
jgi:hypothetical protein